MGDKTVINKNFIEEWDKKYDRLEKDEEKYKKIRDKVSEEIKSSGEISEKTFKRIYKWKTRNRPIKNLGMCLAC